jgi:hypothetical protein
MAPDTIIPFLKRANEDAYDNVQVLAVDKRKDIAFLKIDAVSLGCHLEHGSV